MPFVGAAVVARASLVIMNSSTFDDVLAYMFDYVGLPVCTVGFIATCWCYTKQSNSG